MKPPQVRILDGSTFAVSDPEGDMHDDPDMVLGLFFRDVRHLSRWELRLTGRPLRALSYDTDGYDDAAFFLARPTGTVYRNPSLTVARRRRVGDGLHERLS